jgi:methyl-accepting chemotaxis protein
VTGRARRAWAAVRGATRTIRGQLILSLTLLLGGIVAGVLIGVFTLRVMVRDLNARLDAMRGSTTTNSLLQSGVLNEIAAAEAYLAAPSAELRERFQRTGPETHALRRLYRRLQALGPEDRILVDSIGRLQAQLEVDYAMAHALLDVDRPAEARAAAARARVPADAIAEAIAILTEREAEAGQQASEALARAAGRRQVVLLAVLGVSAVLGVILATVTLRAVESPLARLVRAADRLGEGDLRPVDPGEMATEFARLGRAFGAMGERLRVIVKDVVDESERIAGSAGDLSAISQQLAASSGQISTSMMEISSGAEQQAAKLAEAGAAAGQLRSAASDNAAAADRVAALGQEIRGVAARHREDVRGALGALLEVRGVVQRSGDEVTQLARSSEAIDEFVALVKRIASQTNLLALNAAIEAARAGEHGRGFAVVAEEVRKLADESAAAAERVTDTLEFIRAQVERVTRTMQEGAGKVEGIEVVSQSAARGLEEIVAAVEGVEEAARRVAAAAAYNRQATEEIEGVAQAVSTQASKHAAAAESVTAAAEEQSASTEQMAAAAGEMLAGAERLRKAVSGFRL